MKRLLIYFLGLFVSTIAIAQEIPVPESLKTIPNAKCYWSYSVERVKTKHDSLHKYIISADIQQVDVNGNYKGKLKLNNVVIYCSYVEKGITKKIYFKQTGKNWKAKFKIHTNKSLPLKIIANYNGNERIMPLKLNHGTYPGEPDN